jgi:RNA polymerase sigma factor (sigma-70 family)
MRQTTGFARLPDGGRVAFAVVGSGPAVVLPAWWASHVVEDWHFDPLRRFIEGLAAGRMVVRYDRLGTGLSDRKRPPGTFTPEFEDATLGAVLDELGLARMTMMGISCGGCIAVSFAARQPERVDRLALYGTYAHGHTLGPPQARTGMIDLVRSHWGLGSRLLADVFGPSWSPQDRAAFTASQRAATDADVAADLLADALGELSTREREVLGLVAGGLSDAQIAERLVISPHTVHRHVANILAKLRLPTRAAAVAAAARAGLL